MNSYLSRMKALTNTCTNHENAPLPIKEYLRDLRHPPLFNISCLSHPKATQTTTVMDQEARDKPDEASTAPEPPPCNEWDESDDEAMVQMLRSNPVYMDSVTRLWRQADPSETTSSPPTFFFYGSLMDPDVLRVIAVTSAEPELHKASIKGFKLKMWGFYPTLIPGSADDTVQGMYWQAENTRQRDLLQRYETHRYKPVPCEISIEGEGRTIENGLTFVWAGDPASNELKDGEFLLERYQLYFKPDAFKRDDESMIS